MAKQGDILNLRGEQGGQFIDNTAEHTQDSWAAMVILEDATIVSITMPTFANNLALSGQTLTAGTIIYGMITSIQLTSGIVQMFNYLTDARRAALQEA
jgi:hypothetical protein